MGERLASFNPTAPHLTPFGETAPIIKKPEILSGLTAREAARIAAGTALVLVGCAMILDGSVNHSNLETIGGAIFVIGGIYVLTRK